MATDKEDGDILEPELVNMVINHERLRFDPNSSFALSGTSLTWGDVKMYTEDGFTKTLTDGARAITAGVRLIYVTFDNWSGDGTLGTAAVGDTNVAGFATLGPNDIPLGFVDTNNNNMLFYQGFSFLWQFDGVTPETIVPDEAGASGASNKAGKRDHKHPVICDTAVDITNANAEGDSTSFARANHTHRLGSNTAYGSAQTRYWCGLHVGEAYVGDSCWRHLTDHIVSATTTTNPLGLLDVVFPDGAIVTRLDAWVNYGGADGHDLRVYLDRISSTATAEAMAEVQCTGQTTGYDNFNDTSISYSTVDMSTYRYSLRIFELDSSRTNDVYLSLVKITYTVTKPLP